MERKDYLLILILILAAVFLGSVIMMKNVRVAMVREESPKSEITSNKFLLPRPAPGEDLSLADVMTGIIVLDKEKGLELSSKQKSDIQTVLNEIKPKQVEYEKVTKDIDESVKKLNKILSPKQLKYLAKNRGELSSKMRGVGGSESPDQSILQNLEKSLAGAEKR